MALMILQLALSLGTVGCEIPFQSHVIRTLFRVTKEFPMIYCKIEFVNIKFIWFVNCLIFIYIFWLQYIHKLKKYIELAIKYVFSSTSWHFWYISRGSRGFCLSETDVNRLTVYRYLSLTAVLLGWKYMDISDNIIEIFHFLGVII